MKMRTKEDNMYLTLNFSFHYPKLPLFVRYLAYGKIFIQKAASTQKQKSHCGYVNSSTILFLPVFRFSM